MLNDKDLTSLNHIILVRFLHRSGKGVCFRNTRYGLTLSSYFSNDEYILRCRQYTVLCIVIKIF